VQLQCGKQSLDLSQPKIMGILNVTTDSFSDGGRYFENGQLNLDLALRQAEAMVAAGAAIIDVGGESTRPGAESVSEAEELDRVVPIIEKIKRTLDVIVSVDTSNPVVMEACAQMGAGLINDVRALQRPGAIDKVISLGLPVCLMHMQGEPGTMQQNPVYNDVAYEVSEFLLARATACMAAGLSSKQIILDPGFGFGKTLDHNLKLLRQLGELCDTGFPVLAGLSRKSMLAKMLNRSVDQRLPGSLALAMLAVQQGAKILRVHDVAATQDVLQIWTAFQHNSSPFADQ